MSGASGLAGRLPAIYTLRIEPRKRVSEPAAMRGGETVVAAVRHPPRRQEISQLSALLPEVLARYGITEEQSAGERFEAVA